MYPKSGDNSTPKMRKMKTFSNRLMEVRKAAGYISQDSLAKVLDIPQQTYGNYESGRSFPKEEVLRKIGVVLGVSLDYLMGISNERKESANGVNAKIMELKRNAETTAESINELLRAINKLERTL